jgi:hypothetical protein
MGTTANTDYQLKDEQVSRGIELDANSKMAYRYSQAHHAVRVEKTFN